MRTELVRKPLLKRQFENRGDGRITLRRIFGGSKQLLTVERQLVMKGYTGSQNWRPLVNTVMNYRVILKAGNYLTS
jgi:hypothetical protein